MRYIIDAHAWISYLIGEKAGESVTKIVEDTKNEIFTNIVTLAEVMSIIKREDRDYNESCKIILSLSKIYVADIVFAREVGLLHAEIKKKIKDFGLADAFVLLTARKLNAKIITGDKHFKSFKEAVLLDQFS